MRRSLIIGLSLVAFLTAVPADSASVVREFQGTGNIETADFTVDGPWVMDWRLNGRYKNLMRLDIWLIDSTTGQVLGRAVKVDFPNNGVKLFEDGGTYRLRISSTLADWRVKIQQLTPEEAERYTPKEKPPGLWPTR